MNATWTWSADWVVEGAEDPATGAIAVNFRPADDATEQEQENTKVAAFPQRGLDLRRDLRYRTEALA